MPPGPPIARNFILIVDPSLNFSLSSSPNGDKDATATAFIVGTVPKRTRGDHCGIGERLSCASALPAMRLGSTGPDMTLVSLLNDTQRDIGEQGREDPSLWRATVAACELYFGQHPGFQERDGQSIEFVVADATTHSFHQMTVIDVIEAAL